MTYSIPAITRPLRTARPTAAEPRRRGSAEGLTAPTSDTATVEIAVLYVDFPGLVGRWETDEIGTSCLVAEAHAQIKNTIAAHGGAPVPALLNALSAAFPSAAAATAAARAVFADPGSLPVGIGLASGMAPLDPHGGSGPFRAWDLHARARIAAERAGAGNILGAPAACRHAPARDRNRAVPMLTGLRVRGEVRQ
jgi:class 3 adenylate cyclase